MKSSDFPKVRRIEAHQSWQKPLSEFLPKIGIPQVKYEKSLFDKGKVMFFVTFENARQIQRLLEFCKKKQSNEKNSSQGKIRHSRFFQRGNQCEETKKLESHFIFPEVGTSPISSDVEDSEARVSNNNPS